MQLKRGKDTVYIEQLHADLLKKSVLFYLIKFLIYPLTDVVSSKTLPAV